MTDDDTAAKDELARLTAHKLLDLASVFDHETGSLPPGAFETVMVELGEMRAVSALVDDEAPEGERITVDIGPLLSATGFLLGLFVEFSALKSGQDRLAVINILRETVDKSH